MLKLIELKKQYEIEAKKVSEIFLDKGAYNKEYNTQVDIAMELWGKIIKLEPKKYRKLI